MPTSREGREREHSDQIDKIEESIASLKDMLQTMQKSIMEFGKKGEKQPQLQSEDEEEGGSEDKEKANENEKRVEREEITKEKQAVQGISFHPAHFTAVGQRQLPGSRHTS